MRDLESSLGTRIWRGSFSKLGGQAHRAKAGPAWQGLESGQGGAPASGLIAPAGEQCAAARASVRAEVLHFGSLAGGLETGRGAPTCSLLAQQRRRNMANTPRFDPRIDQLGDLVDDLFKGFFVRPVAYEGRGAEAARCAPRPLFCRC